MRLALISRQVQTHTPLGRLCHFRFSQSSQEMLPLDFSGLCLAQTVYFGLGASFFWVGLSEQDCLGCPLEDGGRGSIREYTYVCSSASLMSINRPSSTVVMENAMGLARKTLVKLSSE
jgi:hypothetical protein